MSDLVVIETEKVSLKDRVIARARSTKQFVARHKTPLAIGAITTPLVIYMARKAGAESQMDRDQAALDEYFESIPVIDTTATDSDSTED